MGRQKSLPGSCVQFQYCWGHDGEWEEEQKYPGGWMNDASWERLKAGREGDNRGRDGWMASPTRWT